MGKESLAKRETEGTPAVRVGGSIWHEPAMVREALEMLRPKPGAVIVDGTMGSGGHSLAILPRILPDGILVGIDRDGDVMSMAKKRLTEFEPQLRMIHGDYRNLAGILDGLGYPMIDGMLLDLGMSSLQVDDAERGFSFMREGPLDMRMDRTSGITAQELIGRLNTAELTQILSAFGEEPYARRIAERIIKVSSRRRIESTLELAQIVTGAIGRGTRRRGRHVATRTFQALRIAVNDELGALDSILRDAATRLRRGARLAIVTYHSLEDRLVKRAFSQGAQKGLWHLVTKKPMRPSRAEVISNPRVRSAKLRAVERC